MYQDVIKLTINLVFTVSMRLWWFKVKKYIFRCK